MESEYYFLKKCVNKNFFLFIDSHVFFLHKYLKINKFYPKNRPDIYKIYNKEY
jgi:hypothetical protein